MGEEDMAAIEEGLAYLDQVPLEWKLLDSAPGERWLAHVQENNERVLRYLAILDEYQGEVAEEEPGTTIQQFQRLETKLNLLLDMVGQVLGEQLNLPSPVPIRLSGVRISWSSPEAIDIGASVAVDIYLNPRYPSPVTLFGHVTGSEAVSGGYHHDLVYERTTPAVQNWIDKLIFRQHRRRIALERQGHKRGRE